ncbi:MAG: hypothetical protein ACRDNK_15705 [Solirubrobacteraceae bacterium]
MTVVPDDGGDFRLALDRTRDAVDTLTSPLGLYLQGPLVPLPQQDGETVAVIADFLLGDLAFADRVQNPQRYAEDDKTREMFADAGLDDPSEALKAQWGKLLNREDDDGDTGSTA